MSPKDKYNFWTSKCSYSIAWSCGEEYIGETVSLRTGLLIDSAVTEDTRLQNLFDSTSVLANSPYYFLLSLWMRSSVSNLENSCHISDSDWFTTTITPSMEWFGLIRDAVVEPRSLRCENYTNRSRSNLDNTKSVFNFVLQILQVIPDNESQINWSKWNKKWNVSAAR